MAKFYRYGDFWHKRQFLTKIKALRNFSLFLGVILTLAASFAQKKNQDLTSLSKVRAQIFERKPSASEHAIDMA